MIQEGKKLRRRELICVQKMNVAGNRFQPFVFRGILGERNHYWARFAVPQRRDDVPPVRGIAEDRGKTFATEPFRRSVYGWFVLQRPVGTGKQVQERRMGRAGPNRKSLRR